VEISEFLDPPSPHLQAAAPGEPGSPVMRRMFEALLDPRSIQWLLMLGGGLAVLGLIIWLVSLRIFDDARILAVALGLGTLALLGAGWWVTLKTRFKTAGRALTFLACVVAPLNLWFYHAQGLILVDDHLWVGAVVCCLLYAATVVVLRDPLFLYAMQAGVTLTVLLLLAELGKITDPTWLSLFAMAIGLILLHAQRAFPPDESAEFSRRRYGEPLFLGGQVIVATSLLILLTVQIVGWLFEPLAALLSPLTLPRPTSLLATNRLLAAGIWLAGVYAYLYSDLAVRRTGRDVYSAAFCLIMAIVTLLVHPQVPLEWLIVALAVAALAANVSQLLLGRQEVAAFDRAVPRIGLVLNVLPLLLGFALHVRATSQVAAATGWAYETGWGFVLAMAVVAACNRVAAWLYRDEAPRWASAYLALTAAALLIGAAGLLRTMGITAWSIQASLLMIIPIIYLGASYLWRGRHPERPLYWVSHAATAIILAHALVAALRDLRSLAPVQGETTNLLLGIVFLEAMAFYLFAAWLRRRGINIYLAAAAACGALWQFLGFYAVPGVWHGLIFSGLGLAFLVAARSIGLKRAVLWREQGSRTESLRGPGRAAFQCGTGILMVAFLAAVVQGFGRLALGGIAWLELTSLALTAVAAAIAALLSPGGTWRRVYGVAAIALAGLTFLTLNELIALSAWRKLEIFCVTAGVLMLAAAHVARFRDEIEAAHNDLIDLGLWLGAALATLPLLIAIFANRFTTGPLLADELALVTITILMLTAGLGLKIRATTFFGGGTLVIYLITLIVALAYHPQIYVGAYIAVGGALVFAVGLLLSIYREKLLALPDQIAKREGVFQVIDWR
jgi:hypothetical protein